MKERRDEKGREKRKKGGKKERKKQVFRRRVSVGVWKGFSSIATLMSTRKGQARVYSPSVCLGKSKRFRGESWPLPLSSSPSLGRGNKKLLLWSSTFLTAKATISRRHANRERCNVKNYGRARMYRAVVKPKHDLHLYTTCLFRCYPVRPRARPNDRDVSPRRIINLLLLRLVLLFLPQPTSPRAYVKLTPLGSSRLAFRLNRKRSRSRFVLCGKENEHDRGILRLLEGSFERWRSMIDDRRTFLYRVS